jgi:hypothetical protein
VVGHGWNLAIWELLVIGEVVEPRPETYITRRATMREP